GRHKCREVWPSLAVERIFTLMLTATLLLVPLVVMAAAYLRVVRTLWLGAQMHTPAGGTSAVTSHAGLKTSVLQHCSSNRVPPPPNTRISVRFRKIPPAARDYERGTHFSPVGGKEQVFSLVQITRQRREEKPNGDSTSTTPP
ncbi:hypothetical protein OTU49_002936, partial [Cherax quadricarinatus]